MLHLVFNIKALNKVKKTITSFDKVVLFFEGRSFLLDSERYLSDYLNNSDITPANTDACNAMIADIGKPISSTELKNHLNEASSIKSTY